MIVGTIMAANRLVLVILPGATRAYRRQAGTNVMRHVLALLICCALTFHVAKAAGAPPIAAHSFRQLQSQAGDCGVGRATMVRHFDTFFQLIASGTAVMETLATGGNGYVL